MPASPASVDAFGFATLSLAIGALQAMLDRGEQLDWFSSMEIRIEALIAVIAFAYFVVHTTTAGDKSMMGGCGRATLCKYCWGTALFLHF